MKQREIPHDTEAEETILATVIRDPSRAFDLLDSLDPMDFYIPAHQRLWYAWERMAENGEKPGALTWAREAEVETDDILKLIGNTLGFREYHVTLVKQARVARDILATATESIERIYDKSDPYGVLEDLDYFTSTVGLTAASEVEAKDIYTIAEEGDAAAPEIIPGLLRQDWRAIVTGAEGTGKGVLLRSMALATAGGYHPMTHKRMKPQRTLLIDLENPRDALLETGLVLADTLVRQSGDDGEPYLIDNCKIWRKPEGINIRDRRDRAALVREIADHRPSLVCIGPWYKMQRSLERENWESSALAALSVLDRLRVKYGFALVIEAHSPVAPPGVKRPLRPMGSAYLSAWPELGIGLRREEEGTTLNVEWWRGARLKQSWPQRIVRDPRWVVSGAWDNYTPNF